MKLHIYTNNAHDTVALINDQDQVISHWDALERGGEQATAMEDALYATDITEWEGQAHAIDVDDYATGNDLVLVIREDGEWEFYDRDLLIKRLSFHLGGRHPIVQALYV